MAKEKTKNTETVEAPSTATAQPTAPAQPDPMALSIGDLKGLSTIIDVASSRGAFKAAELAGVGILYNKLQAFLAKVAPEQNPEGAVAPATAPATAEGK